MGAGEAVGSDGFKCTLLGTPGTGDTHTASQIGGDNETRKAVTNTMWKQGAETSSAEVHKGSHSIAFKGVVRTVGANTNSYRATQSNQDVFFHWSDASTVNWSV